MDKIKQSPAPIDASPLNALLAGMGVEENKQEGEQQDQDPTVQTFYMKNKTESFDTANTNDSNFLNTNDQMDPVVNALQDAFDAAASKPRELTSVDFAYGATLGARAKADMLASLDKPSDSSYYIDSVEKTHKDPLQEAYHAALEAYFHSIVPVLESVAMNLTEDALNDFPDLAIDL